MSNIKELIRREIERRKNKAETIRERGVYLELLSFLDTLEEPVSDCHDLEEAARAYSEEVTDGHNYRDLTCGFIAGAEWQKAKMISALKNDGDLPIEFIDKFHEIDRTAFQNGQVNMREQMMEGAVAVEVVGEKRDLRLIDSTQRCLFDSKRGDWLKIIIVKEGEQ